MVYSSPFKYPERDGIATKSVVTVNLPYVALSSIDKISDFYDELDRTLEICHRALMIRHNTLKGTKAEVAPILWQHGALARLNAEDTIDELLYGGYSTISLGYAGLAETVQALIKEPHTSENGKKLAKEIMQHLNNKTNEWKELHNIDFSVYGTPLESTTDKFAAALQREFGVIENVSDRAYITNSYHVHVAEQIDAFDKLSFEGEFQTLSPGGAISYIETSNLQNNIPAVLSVMQFIYDNIMYAELNTKSDYCMNCGYDGEIQIEDIDGDLLWVCPNCKCKEQDKLYVTRRTCGYIGTSKWNYGRSSEIKDRFIHVSVPEEEIEEVLHPTTK